MQRQALQTAGLERDLMKIKVCYSPLVEMLKKTESTHYTIEEAYEDIFSLNFHRYPAKITEYIRNALKIMKLIKLCS